MSESDRNARALARASVEPPRELPAQVIKPVPFATALRALIVAHWTELSDAGWLKGADAESSVNGNVVADYAFAAQFLKDEAGKKGIDVIANAITAKVMKGFAAEKSRLGYGQRKLKHAYRVAYSKKDDEAA